MKTSHYTIASAVTAALGAFTLTQAFAGPAAVPNYENEKCFGVNAAGQNDCQTAANSCAGQVSMANQGDAWIYVPAGVCAKINGGSLTAK
jgi:uncharacterized membrane protein